MILQTFERTAQGYNYKATIEQKPDGGYLVTCSSWCGAVHTRGFVNFKHAVDYALDWIRP